MDIIFIIFAITLESRIMGGVGIIGGGLGDVEKIV